MEGMPYSYMILVFAPAVCGESVTKEVFDFDPSDKNIPEDEKKRWWKKAAKKLHQTMRHSC